MILQELKWLKMYSSPSVFQPNLIRHLAVLLFDIVSLDSTKTQEKSLIISTTRLWFLKAGGVSLGLALQMMSGFGWLVEVPM